jgi:hypothetical protein
LVALGVAGEVLPSDGAGEQVVEGLSLFGAQRTEDVVFDVA